jgi:hypothetical protein
MREEFGHVAGILVDSVDQLQEHICQGSVDASKTSGWTETHMFVKKSGNKQAASSSLSEVYGLFGLELLSFSHSTDVRCAGRGRHGRF